MESILYGAFVWARRTLNRQKRWFPARAVNKMGQTHELFVLKPATAAGWNPWSGALAAPGEKKSIRLAVLQQPVAEGSAVILG